MKNTIITTIVILLASLSSLSAQALSTIYKHEGQFYHLPVFDRGLIKQGSYSISNIQQNEEEPEWSQDLLTVYSTIRVKVFPHNAKFNAPHNKDTTINKVKLSSVGNCNMYKADRPTSEGGITRTTLLQTGKSFELTLVNLKEAIWLECEDPIAVTRPDFPQTPTRYLGVMFAKPVDTTNGNYITLVNVIRFEDYLRGVVPSEMPASWAQEALKAQAIAARSYAFYELASKVSLLDNNIQEERSGAQFDDTVTYQAYKGLNNTTAATDKAIKETSGQVMVHEGKVVKAYFSADSGGHTENAENVWGKYLPYIIGKPEPYPDGSIPGTTWVYSPGFQEIQDKLVANKFLTEQQSLANVRINKDDYYPSTRPSHIELVLQDGSIKRILAVDFSFAMRIKSPWIKISTNLTNRTATFNGRGFGHGAGMNQWGAKVMVDKLNYNHIGILKFYYTGIELTEVAP
jgi:stage II sporulation protein D